MRTAGGLRPSWRTCETAVRSSCPCPTTGPTSAGTATAATSAATASGRLLRRKMHLKSGGLATIAHAVTMSIMTWITYEEASLISRSSKRPRFALCVWLALLELAEGEIRVAGQS